MKAPAVCVEQSDISSVPRAQRTMMHHQCPYPANNLYPSLILQSLDDDSRKALADFFSEGHFKHKGCINSENVNKYLAISRQLHHEQLQLECVSFLSNSENFCSRVHLYPRAAEEASRYQLMFTGSKTKKSAVNVHVYDCKNNFQKSCSVPELSNVGEGCAVCCLQENDNDAPHVYVSGGNDCSGEVYHCDIVMNKKKKCSKKLVKGRSYHCMNCVQHKLYVLGGRNRKGETVTMVEEFTPKRHSWTQVGKLEVGVHSATSVVLGQHIYVLGGIMDNGKETVAVQRFDPKTKSCVLLHNLSCPVSGGQAVVRDGKIYIACGNGRLVSYDPESSKDIVCTNLPVCCSNFAMFVEKEGIFLAGGQIQNDSNAHAKVYMYSPEKCTWHITDKELSSPLSVIGSCTVEIPATYKFVPFFN